MATAMQENPQPLRLATKGTIMENNEYEKAWQEKEQLEAGQTHEHDMAKDATAETDSAQDAKGDVIATAPIQTASPSKPNVKAEADAKAASDAEEFRKAFADTPDVGETRKHQSNAPLENAVSPVALVIEAKK